MARAVRSGQVYLVIDSGDGPESIPLEVNEIQWGGYLRGDLANGPSETVIVRGTSWEENIVEISVNFHIDPEVMARMAETMQETAERMTVFTRLVEESEPRQGAFRRILGEYPDVRSKNLLMSMLDTRQRHDLERYGFFEVKGQISGTRYRIHTTSTIQNIQVMENEMPITFVCGGPQGVPEYDIFLTQKLGLELNEIEFLDRCNISGRHPINPVARINNAFFRGYR